MIENFLIGALGSLIASAIFLLLLHRYRPKLILSSKIAKTSYDGKIVYAFKVINSGKRDVIGIRGELLLIEPHVVKGGIGKNILQFDLVRDQWFYLPPVKTISDDIITSYEFITFDQLEEEWSKKKNSYLQFRIYAQDAFSGFSKVFSQTYYSSGNTIHNGRFAIKESMEICD